MYWRSSLINKAFRYFYHTYKIIHFSVRHICPIHRAREKLLKPLIHFISLWTKTKRWKNHGTFEFILTFLVKWVMLSQTYRWEQRYLVWHFIEFFTPRFCYIRVRNKYHAGSNIRYVRHAPNCNISNGTRICIFRVKFFMPKAA